MKYDPFTRKCYGLDGQSAHNYVKYGIYARDDDPRLNTPMKRRVQRWKSLFR